MSAELNFVRQQGFRDASASSCGHQYEALMVQPRVIGVLILAGVLLQHAPFFLALGALLWWNAVVPRRAGGVRPADAAVVADAVAGARRIG